MISTLTGAGAGPVNGYLAYAPYFNLLTLQSRKKNALALAQVSSGFSPSLSISADRLYGGVFSDNASYFVLAGEQVSSVGLRFYQRSGSTFNQISIPAGSLNRTFFTCDITPNGEYFCGDGRIYHNNNGSLTFLQSVTNGAGSGISPDGVFVACNSGSGSFPIFKRSGSGNSATFASHQTISIDANSAIQAARFSRDGTYLAVVFRNVNSVHILRVYKYNATTDAFDSLNQPPSGGTFVTNTSTLYGGLSWAYDNSFVAVSTWYGATALYERSGDTFTYRTALSSSNDGNVGSFHPNNNLYVTGQGKIYRKVASSNWTLQRDLALGGNTFFCAFSPSLT
jgi:hypothetical protein